MNHSRVLHMHHSFTCNLCAYLEDGMCACMYTYVCVRVFQYHKCVFVQASLSSSLYASELILSPEQLMTKSVIRVSPLSVVTTVFLWVLFRRSSDKLFTL